VPYHRYLVGDRERLVLVVGDQDRGGAGLAKQPPDVGADGRPEARVEGTEGFVEQDEAGLDGERPGERDPLLLPAGELMRIALAEPGHADRVEQVNDHRATPFSSWQAEADVGGHRQMREQGAILRHVADAPPFRWHPVGGPVDDPPADPDGAGIGLLEAGDYP
jgi:hypothetical protein